MPLRRRESVDAASSRGGGVSLRLSRSEVRELCGTPIKARQCEFLRRNGIAHYLEADGTPVVLRAAIEPRAERREDSATWKPNKAA